MTIRKAVAEDAARLAAFGRQVFGQTFAPDNDPADLQAYLHEAYAEARQLAEIADPRVDTLLVEDEGGTLVAFAQLREGPAGDGVAGERPVELWRFYVDAAWHGRGVAASLMREVDAAAQARNAGTLWLGVWERNTRAQAFYRKQGFTVVGSQIFMLGPDPQRDLVMAREVAVS
jgi:ribosomal protein S18 acetylase RimI-like enzyme